MSVSKHVRDHSIDFANWMIGNECTAPITAGNVPLWFGNGIDGKTSEELYDMFLSEQRIEFSIGPSNERDHEEILKHIPLIEGNQIKHISFDGDHYSEIYVYGHYNQTYSMIKDLGIKNISIEHWADD